MWSVLYWVLLVLAVLVLLRGLLWDRAGFRGRPERRCRRCWYDLTGVDGDVSEGAVVCPECGKGHKSKRSMRRTRRGKWWIVGAVVVWGLAYGASVTPRVQKNGWGAAVPRVVVVASLPFLSEVPGSGLGSMQLGVAKPMVISRFDRFVLGEVGSPSFPGWGRAMSSDPGYGWFSRRLAFWLARLESDATLTNSTQAKGRAYQQLLTNIVNSGGALKSEAKWANELIYVEFDIDRAFGPGEDVYGSMKIRRLIQGGYRLQFGDMVSVYQCSTPNSMRLNGFQPMQPTIDYWVERFLWDSMNQLDFARGSSGYYEYGDRFSAGQDLGNGIAKSRVSIWISEYDSSKTGDRKDPSSWSRVATVTREFEYRLDPDRVIVGDSSAALRAAIERNIKARLTVEFDRTRSEWVPVVKLELNKRASPPNGGGILFGGGISINVVWADSYDPDGLDFLKGSWGNWWLWSGREIEGKTIEFPDDANTPAMSVTMPASKRVELRASNEMNSRLPGELDPMPFRVTQDGKAPARVVLKMKCPQGTGWQHFGGLWGGTVYEGELVFEIEKWTPMELKRYIVNGIVPDHAMPGGG